MESPTLEDFVAWNNQLAALVDAGVPLDLGVATAHEGLGESLDRINTTVSRRVRRGESLEEAVEDEERFVPAAYRSLFLLGLRGGDLNAPLDAANRVARSVDEGRYTIRSAFVYPLILCGLVFCGLILFCQYLVPSLDTIYNGLHLPPGSGLRALRSLRDALPYWVILVPLLCAFAFWRWRAASRRALQGNPSAAVTTWLPGTAKTILQQRSANFAVSLATLLDQHIPIAEALPIAAGACVDAKLGAAAESLAAAFKAGSSVADNSPTAIAFPPFLRWALLDSETTTGRPRALRLAAGIYRDAVRRREDRLRIVAPLAVCVVIGGGATLLYGLSLFVPVVQLLRTIALPPR
jgi:general secretion pathway protein F